MRCRIASMGSMLGSVLGSMLRIGWVGWIAGGFVAGQGSAAQAEAVRFYELEGFERFLEGDLQTTAIGEEGVLTLPPAAEEIFQNPAVSFSAATAQQGKVVAARVEDGQVMAVDAKGQVQLLFKPAEPMTTALLARSNDLWVASGPEAKIYHIDRYGKANVFFTPQAHYVWAMAQGPKGSLYVATGEPAQVIKIDRRGHGTVLFQPEQTHLRCLAYDPTWGLFAGGGTRGILYRSTDETHWRALYDSGDPEVTAVAVRDGFAYMASVTGVAQLATRNETGSKAAEPSFPEVHSQLIQIGMDGTADVVAQARDEAIFDMVFQGPHRLVAATGALGPSHPRGRLYSIDLSKRLVSLMYQSPSKRITHLVNLSSSERALPHLAALAAGGGRITTWRGHGTSEGLFFSSAFDTGIHSKFGLLQILGLYPAGTWVDASVRTGQTSEPDPTWSAWSAPLRAPGDRSVEVPSGRYVQIKLRLHGTPTATPWVQRLRLAYLRQNLPPRVRTVTVLRKGWALWPMPKEDHLAKIVALDDTSADASDPEDKPQGFPLRARQIPERGALTIKWLAEDPNGDSLRYAIWVRSMPQGPWQLLKDNLEESFWTFQSQQLPDGYYQFRVQATDAPSNPPGLERMDVRDSRMVLIDNTPPQFGEVHIRRQGRGMVAQTTVKDALGPLVDLSYALDGGMPRPVVPEDGILDGPSERITLSLGNLAAGRHTLTFRAVDGAGNEGFGAATFEVKS